MWNNIAFHAIRVDLLLDVAIFLHHKIVQSGRKAYGSWVHGTCANERNKKQRMDNNKKHSRARPC